MNPESNHNQEERFSKMLKNAEEPFDATAWELYLASKKTTNHQIDPKPFNPSPWKFLGFDKYRIILATGLAVLFLISIFIYTSNNNSTNVGSTITIDTLKPTVDTVLIKNESDRYSKINYQTKTDSILKTNTNQKLKEKKKKERKKDQKKNKKNKTSKSNKSDTPKNNKRADSTRSR